MSTPPSARASALRVHTRGLCGASAERDLLLGLLDWGVGHASEAQQWLEGVVDPERRATAERGAAAPSLGGVGGNSPHPRTGARGARRRPPGAVSGDARHPGRAPRVGYTSPGTRRCSTADRPVSSACDCVFPIRPRAFTPPTRRTCWSPGRPFPSIAAPRPPRWPICAGWSPSPEEGRFRCRFERCQSFELATVLVTTGAWEEALVHAPRGAADRLRRRTALDAGAMPRRTSASVLRLPRQLVGGRGQDPRCHGPGGAAEQHRGGGYGHDRLGRGVRRRRARSRPG